MAAALTTAQIRDLPAAIPLETAGRAFGMCRSATFTHYHRGDLPFPVIQIGRRLIVTKADLMAALGLGDPIGEQPG